MTVNKSSVKIKIYFVVEVENMADKKIKELLKDAGKYELTESERAKADGSFIDLPCGNTHYEVRGDGELCVLVHGYATPYYIYDKVADELVKNGYKILRYDLLGRGLSERVKAKYTPELFATQLKELTGSLFGDEKFYLFGTSMGGTIVNAFCAAYPEYVKKLILLAPAGMDSFKPPFYMYLSSCPVVGDILFAFLGNKILLKSCAREMKYSVNEIDYYTESFAKSIKYKGFPKCTLSSLRNTILKTKKATGFYKKTAAHGTPVLCLWGKNDITMPFYQAERFKEIMPDAELHALEGSGHIFLYDEIDKTMRYVLPFLQKQS